MKTRSKQLMARIATLDFLGLTREEMAPALEQTVRTIRGCTQDERYPAIAAAVDGFLSQAECMIVLEQIAPKHAEVVEKHTAVVGDEFTEDDVQELLDELDELEAEAEGEAVYYGIPLPPPKPPTI